MRLSSLEVVDDLSRYLMWEVMFPLGSSKCKLEKSQTEKSQKEIRLNLIGQSNCQ